VRLSVKIGVFFFVSDSFLSLKKTAGKIIDFNIVKFFNNPNFFLIFFAYFIFSVILKINIPITVGHP
jgi:hypothetical protein